MVAIGHAQVLSEPRSSLKSEWNLSRHSVQIRPEWLLHRCGMISSSACRRPFTRHGRITPLAWAINLREDLLAVFNLLRLFHVNLDRFRRFLCQGCVRAVSGLLPVSVSQPAVSSIPTMPAALKEWSERQDLNLRRLGPKPIFDHSQSCPRLPLFAYSCPTKYSNIQCCQASCVFY